MNIAIIGYGSIGRRHTANAVDLERFREVAVVSRSASEVPKGAKLVGSIDELAASPPDLAVVATPASARKDLIEKLTAKGVHLLIEKPLAASVEDGRIIVEAVSRANVIAVAGYNLRYLGAIRTLKSALDEGRVGDVVSARVSVGSHLSRWRLNRPLQDTVTARSDLGGGALLELSHELDYSRFLFGAPIRSFAALRKTGQFADDVEDVVECITEMQSDRGTSQISIHLDLLDWQDHRSCRIVGTKGTLSWEGGSTVNLIRENRASQYWEGEPYGDGMVKTYVDELNDFADAVETGASPSGCSIEEAQGVVEWIEVLRQSAETSRWISHGEQS